MNAKELTSSLEENFSEQMLNQLAKQTGFLQRQRKLSVSNFVNTLMFASSTQANTSLPDMTADLYQQFCVDISKEALHNKFSPQAVIFLKELVKVQLSQQISLKVDAQLSKYFTAIKIKDSSKFSLPTMYNGDYPGFGNFSRTNGLMNLQYEYDLLSGKWNSIELTSAKINDQQDSKLTKNSIAKGELHIRDLGYVTPIYLQAIKEKEAFFLNRLPTNANLYSLKNEPIDWKSIARKFKKSAERTLDMDILLYANERLKCRLVIEPVSDNEYQKRLKQAENSAKSHRVGLSKEHKLRCRYSTFITNIDKEILPIEKIRKTYYLRWQIELVFKTWKSFFQINKVKKVKKERLECQLLAKLLWVLLNWQLFQSCNRYIQKKTPEKGVSLLKFFKRCLSFSNSLRLVVLNPMNLANWLRKMFLPLIENTACEAPVGKRTYYQILNSFICLS